jgi:hypothetical protein
MNKEIIYWNLINSFLAGCLVMLGAFSDGKITKEGIFLAVVAGLIVMITKFKDFWSGSKPKRCKGLFTFIRF